MKRTLMALVLLGNGLPAYLGGQPAHASTGTGNIVVEVRDLDGIRDGLQKQAQSNGVALRNYSEYANNRGKRSLNATYELDKAAVSGFMDGLAKLGKMTSRNYTDHDGSGNDRDAQVRRLESYRRHLQKVLAAPGADPEIVTLLVQQIQSLESQYGAGPAADAPAGKTAAISVQICERGYNSSGFPISPQMFVILAAAFFCAIGVALGVMLARLAALKGQRPAPVA